ncbi:MAG: Rrf2 family transcriptional regulator [Microthrixaceae bacterium]
MRLEVTRRSDIAVRALLALEEADGRITAAELGERIDASPKFVPHAVGPLVTAGWVTSDPGRTGGYALATPLDDISLRDVVECIEGPIDSGRCVVAKRPCSADAPCALHLAWTNARRHLVDNLASTAMSSLRGLARNGCFPTSAQHGDGGSTAGSRS